MERSFQNKMMIYSVIILRATVQEKYKG